VNVFGNTSFVSEFCSGFLLALFVFCLTHAAEVGNVELELPVVERFWIVWPSGIASIPAQSKAHGITL
jgi:hypothetical protein